MAIPLKIGALQADGSIKPEASFDVQHVADAIVHVAGLPNDVTILVLNIMYVTILVFPPRFLPKSSLFALKFYFLLSIADHWSLLLACILTGDSQFF